MPTSAMKACFQIAECSFSSAKIMENERKTSSLLFTNNGSFFINNFSKNHRIFVEEKLHSAI